MPYKDIDTRRIKSRGYSATYKAKKKADMLAKKLKTPRYCALCGVNITHMRSDALFCSRVHKRIQADKKRNFAIEYAKNRDRKRKLGKQYYYADVDHTRQKQREWQRNNLQIFALNTAKRRAAKIKRSPTWLTEDDKWLIKEIYDLATVRSKHFGFSWHVDHIIPLQGKTVSGLHVPQNMQVIPGVHNIAKHNMFEVI